jgi:hypothetical protein
MPTTKPVALLSLALTPEERRALKIIAAREDVSMSRIIREVLAREYDEFRAATTPREHERTA